MRLRFFAILVSALMCICTLNYAHADGTEKNMPTGTASSCMFYTDEFTVLGDEDPSYIVDESVIVNSASTGSVSIAVSVSTNAVMKKLGFTKLHLQHWSGNSWENVWTKEDQYSNNTDSFYYSTTLHNLTSNDYYRIQVELYAKKGFLQVQTMTITSNYILCR